MRFICRRTLGPAVCRLVVGLWMGMTGLFGLVEVGRAQGALTDAGTFEFTSGNYYVTDRETSAPPPGEDRGSYPGAWITVTRYGGARGKVLLDVFTIVPETIDTNDLNAAEPNRDYFITTNTLVFDDYQMSTNFIVPIGRGAAEGDPPPAFKTFEVGMANPRPAPGENPQEIMPVLGALIQATVRIAQIGNESPSVGTNLSKTFSFERANYQVREDHGSVVVAVVRPSGATAEKVSVNVNIPTTSPDWRYAAIMAGSRRADYGDDYDASEQTIELDFPQNTTRRTITLNIVDDGNVEFNEDITMAIVTRDSRGNQPAASVTIRFDDPPPGALDRNWNPDVVSSQTPPYNPNPGANGIVQAVVIQPDQRAVIGGQFTAYNTVPRNFLARIQPNGFLDASFLASPNTGPNSVVNAIVLYGTNQPPHDGKFLIGGGFTAYNGVLRRGVARILANGTLDTTFNPGNGVDGLVLAVALQTDGKVILGGDFFSVDGVFQPYLARLNADGSFDATFRPVLDWPVYAVALDSAQRIVLGGDFFTINDDVRPGIARLTPDGSVDATFNPGGGADRTVYALAVDTADRVLVGGAFTLIDFRARRGVARLNPDGSLDDRFHPGIGANDDVKSIVLYPTAGDPDVKALIGGAFTEVNYTRRLGLARLFANGTVDTSFLDAGYNQFAGFINEYSFQPNNFVNAIGLQEDGNVIVGGKFATAGGNHRDPTYTRAQKRNRANVARILGGELTGPGNLGFALSDYTVDENGGRLYVTISRVSGSLGGLAALAGTAANTATVDVDYTPVTTAVSAGNNSLVIPIRDDALAEGNETVNLLMFFPLAGLVISGENMGINGALHRAEAVMTIVDNDFFPGRFTFSAPIYTTNENGRFGIITVERLGGSDGSVSVDYFTAPGTATNTDYTSRSGNLFFAPGQTTRTFTVPLFDDILVEDDETVFLALTNATGGAVLDFSSVDPSFDPGLGAEGPVYATAVYTNTGDFGKVAIGGNFTAYNGQPRGRLARLHRDGSLDTTFSASAAADGMVRALAIQGDGKLLVGGDFTTLNTASVNRLARLRNTGSVDTGFDIGSGADATVRAIALQTNGAILVGGDFLTFDGDGSHGYLVQLEPDGTIDDTFEVTLDGPVRSLVVLTNGQILVAGDFGEVNGDYGYYGLVRLNVDGSTDFEFYPDLAEGGSVHTIAVQTDNRIVAGGKLIGNGSSPHLVRLERRGGTDATFNIGTGPDAPVYSVAVHTLGIYTNHLVLGGAFTTVNGTPRMYLARLKPNGSVDDTVDLIPGVNGLVWNVSIQNDNRVLLGGDFSQVNYLSRRNLARLSPAQATLVIVDDDFSAGRLSFTSLGYTTNESAGAAWIGVKRSGGNLGFLTVEAMTTFGTAEPGVDYVPTTNTLVWNSGDSDVKYLVIPLLDDTLPEGLETVNVLLANPSVAGALGTVTESVLTIENDDFPGRLRFSAAAYGVPESSGSAVITVIRTGGTAGAAAVSFATSPGTATPGTDYTETNNVLNFADGVSSQAFRVQIADDATGNPNRTVNLTLSGAAGAELGQPATAQLTIIDNESENSPAGSVDTTFDTPIGANASVYAVAVQPDGQTLVAGDFTQVNNISRHRLARLSAVGGLDTAFNVSAGPDAPVRALALQPDGKMLIGGFFNAIGGVNRGRVARLNIDGTLDNSFEPGGGADGSVYALALTAEGQVLLGGSFTRVNGLTRPNIALLEANGRVAARFDAGIGPDDAVFAVAVQSDGRMLIGGDFLSVNNQPRPYLARLNRDGSVDATFDVGMALNDTVRSLAVQSDGRILVGGSFTAVGGGPRNYLARFHPDGTLDDTFMAGQTGGNNAVYALALQVDEKILVVGEFTQFNGVTRNRITRLEQDGHTDPTINFGTGANAFVAALAVDGANRIVIGGGFSEVNGVPRARIARLYGGAITGAGRLEFSAPNFNVHEYVTNALVTVRRVGGTAGEVSVRVTTSPGTGLAGADYADTTTTVSFPSGEVVRTVTIPIVDDPTPELPETVALALDQLTGATLGPQPVATLTIVSDDSVISFDRLSYREPENTISGRATLTVIRQYATNSAVSVSYGTTTAFPPTTVRLAVPGTEFIPTNGVLLFQAGETQKNLFVNLVDNTFPDGNRVLAVQLADPAATLPSRTALLGETAQARLTIVDNEVFEGAFNFSAIEYQVVEANTNAVITVRRDNGSSGIVSVNYRITGGTAIPGVDYQTVGGTIAFADGENLNQFVVPILDDAVWEENKTLELRLELPTGGAQLGTVTNVVLTILDDESAPPLVSFATNRFDVVEDEPVAIVVVTRSFNLTEPVSVEYFTQDGSARAGTDYVPTNGVIYFARGENFKTFGVPILNNTLVQSNRTVHLFLTNVSAGAFLQPPVAATLHLADDDSSIGFSSTHFTVLEDATNALISVTRRGVTNRTIRVDYLTRAGTASAGADYTTSSGTLTFAPGETTVTFPVPVVDDDLVEFPETVRLFLTNVVGLAVIQGGEATLTIQDNDSRPGVVTYTRARYSVVERGTNAVITVVRTNGYTGDITVEYTTTPLTAAPGLDYISRSGVLTFRNNETNRDIAIPVLDDDLVEGNEEFLVTLFNPVGTSISGLTNAVVSIVDDELGPGTLDPAFDPGEGPSGLVRAVAAQPDGRVLIGGAFTNVSGYSRRHIARLNTNGTVDVAFNPGQGANAIVASLGLTGEGRILLGGSFTNVNGVPANYIARLMSSGQVDTNFNQSPGLNASLNTLAVQNNDKVVIGGNFTLPTRGVARLQTDGSVDTSFDPVSGTDGVVLCSDLQTNGLVAIGGTFTLVNGFPRGRVARLLANGALDQSFVPAPIPYGSVYAVAQTAEQKVILGGSFTNVDGQIWNRIVRLEGDGSLDASFNVGTGANDTVYALLAQPDGKVIVAGDFTMINGVPSQRYARLNADGSVDTTFQVGSGANNTIFDVAQLPDGSLIIGGDFTQVNGYPRRGVARIFGDEPPLVLPVGRLEGTQWRVTLASQPGRQYVLEGSVDLINWLVLSTTTATGPTLDLVDPNAGAQRYRFYRVRW